MTKIHNPKGAGRKLFEGKDEKEVVSKLEYAFLRSFTDEEAAFHAGISLSALNRYIDSVPGLRHRKEVMKRQPRMKSKAIVYQSLEEGNILDAKWVLENSASDEYSKQIKQEISGELNFGVVMLPPKEVVEQIEETTPVQLPNKTNDSEGLDTISETGTSSVQD